MPAARILPEKQVIEALHKHAGNVAAAAAALGLDRTALHRRIAKSETLREAKRAGGEIVNDLADGVILRHLKNNNLTAAMFVKNNHPASKAAGWGPRTEVTGAEGGGVQIVIKYADA